MHQGKLDQVYQIDISNLLQFRRHYTCSLKHLEEANIHLCGHKIEQTKQAQLTDNFHNTIRSVIPVMSILSRRTYASTATK